MRITDEEIFELISTSPDPRWDYEEPRQVRFEGQ